MGDRGNVEIGGVYLYTHSGGSDLPMAVREALAKGWRWDDPPYLARIIFDEMTKGEQGTELGYGISTEIIDNEHPIIHVDCARQEVRFDDYLAFSFKEYVGESDEELQLGFDIMGRED